MFCGRCGAEVTGGARFCSACGAAVTGAGAPGAPGQYAGQAPWGGFAQDPMTRLIRPRGNRMIAGVCAGLARHYGWDLTWTRVLTVLIAVFSSGAGVVAYIVFWIVMPEEPWLLNQAFEPGQGAPPPPPSPPAAPASSPSE